MGLERLEVVSKMIVGIEHSAVNGQAQLAKPLWGFAFSARGFIPVRTSPTSACF